MTPLATVLYEDKMSANANGEYPLHDFVMRMVEDDINGHTWQLGKLVAKNPRNGVNKLIKDVESTSLIAQTGKLMLLVDKDRIGEHLGLGSSASDDDVVAELKRRSDAPEKLDVFFLYPNLEGLLRAIQACDPSLLPKNMEAALCKKLNDRDLIFKEVKKANLRSLRECVHGKQQGLRALMKALAAALLASEAFTSAGARGAR